MKDERPTLSEVGIDKHLADRARKLSAMTNNDFQSLLVKWRTRIESSHDMVTINVLNERVLQLKREQAKQKEEQLEKPDIFRPMDDLVKYEEVVNGTSTQSEEYETIKGRYERMLRENWSGSDLPERYNTAAKVVADAMWRVIALSGLISVRLASREFVLRDLFDIAEKLDDRLMKLEEAHFAILRSEWASH